MNSKQVSWRTRALVVSDWMRRFIFGRDSSQIWRIFNIFQIPALAILKCSSILNIFWYRKISVSIPDSLNNASILSWNISAGIYYHDLPLLTPCTNFLHAPFPFCFVLLVLELWHYWISEFCRSISEMPLDVSFSCQIIIVILLLKLCWSELVEWIITLIHYFVSSVLSFAIGWSMFKLKWIYFQN